MLKYYNDLQTILAQYRRGLRDVDGMRKGFMDVLEYASEDSAVSKAELLTLVKYVCERW